MLENNVSSLTKFNTELLTFIKVLQNDIRNKLEVTDYQMFNSKIQNDLKVLQNK